MDCGQARGATARDAAVSIVCMTQLCAVAQGWSVDDRSEASKLSANRSLADAGNTGEWVAGNDFQGRGAMLSGAMGQAMPPRVPGGSS